MLMLEDGKRKGLTEDETLRELKTFIPSSRTPSLNFLYYFMNENHDYVEPECDTFMGINMEGFIDTIETLTDEERETYRKDIDEVVGKYMEQYNIEDNEGSSGNVPIFDSTVFGENMTYDIFKKIKKLKTLSTSENKFEADSARQMGIKLCLQFGLDFNKMPTNI